MSRRTISVGMPNFNHGRFLPTALDALLAQSHRPDEIIVIDDASTDNSVEIISDYAARHSHLRLIRHRQNRGIGATLAELLGVATGDYFFAPAADDMILPGFFEKSMALLERYSQAGLCSAQIYFMDEAGVRRGTSTDRPIRRGPEGYYISPARCASIIRSRGLWIHGNTAIFHRQAFLQAGGYREELGHYQDGFMHQLLALKHGVCFIPEILAAERRMPETYSARAKKNPAEMARIRELASGYMLGEYQAIFPPSLVRQWRARWDYWRMMAHSHSSAGEWRNGLSQLLLPGNVCNRLLFLFCSALIALGLTVIRAVAVLFIMPLDSWRIVRNGICAATYQRIHRRILRWAGRDKAAGGETA